MKVRWQAWLSPRYVLMRVLWFFGWRPEWVRRINNQKLRPQVLLMDQHTYDDLIRAVRAEMTTFRMTDEEFEKFGSDLRKYDFKPDWER